MAFAVSHQLMSRPEISSSKLSATPAGTGLRLTSQLGDTALVYFLCPALGGFLITSPPNSDSTVSPEKTSKFSLRPRIGLLLVPDPCA